MKTTTGAATGANVGVRALPINRLKAKAIVENSEQSLGRARRSNAQKQGGRAFGARPPGRESVQSRAISRVKFS
ncbi:hypothetical protein, partial [Paraburkholderia sp.]|uniref:hypothetical protein n=1 Tax=Paraburkholderia sp. TaxID=1926495 RepID=UPI00286EF912